MAGIIALLTFVFVLALLFKPFFNNRDGFKTSAYHAFTQYRYLKWAGQNQLETNMWSTIKFYLWFIIGGIAGYVVNVLVS